MRFKRNQRTFKNNEEMHKHFINDLLNIGKHYEIRRYPFDKVLISRNENGENIGIGDIYTLEYTYIKGYKYSIMIYNHFTGEVFTYIDKMIKY